MGRACPNAPATGWSEAGFHNPHRRRTRAKRTHRRYFCGLALWRVRSADSECDQTSAAQSMLDDARCAEKRPNPALRHIRNKGAMNAIISSELDGDNLKKELDKVPSMAGLELSSIVSTEEPYTFGDEGIGYKVAVLDLGIKKSILKRCGIGLIPLCLHDGN